MIELTADCFQEICSAAPVREQLGSLETNRQAAVRRFWIWLAAALVLAVAAFITLSGAGWTALSWIAAVLLLTIGVMVAMSGLSKVSGGLKTPVLEAIAGRAGMEYMANGFSPPAYPEAEKALFGSWLSQRRFSDLFHGKDEEGRNYAVYEAHLSRSNGKNQQTIFQGQVYAVERRAGSGATTVIVPDRGLFNFFKPAGGLQRVRIDGDEAFEKKFEVYSTSEMEAKQLLFDTAFRQRLLDMRQGGRVFVYVAPDNALVAASGGDKFETGSMFRSRPGEDRVRSMLDDVCAALATLRALKAKFG